MGSWVPAGLKVVIDALFAQQTAINASWHTADPGTTGANEYTSNAIGRVSIGTMTTSSDTDSADATNAAAITSASATGATSALTHVGLFTASSGGTFLGDHQLSSSVTLALGEKIRIPAGDLDISFPVS